MTTSDLDFQSLVKNNAGPKLRMLLTGVGSFAAGLLGIPGSSALIDSISIPYSRESVELLLTRLHPNAADVLESASSVSQEMAVALHMCNSLHLKGAIPLTVTGAITTSRYRKGNNHAFIALGQESVEVWHLLLDKLEEHEHTEENVNRKRHVQDVMVCSVAIALALGISTPLVDELQRSHFLVRV